MTNHIGLLGDGLGAIVGDLDGPLNRGMATDNVAALHFDIDASARVFRREIWNSELGATALNVEQPYGKNRTVRLRIGTCVSALEVWRRRGGCRGHRWN